MIAIAPCETCRGRLEAICLQHGLPKLGVFVDRDEAEFLGWLFAKALVDCPTCAEQLPPELVAELRREAPPPPRPCTRCGKPALYVASGPEDIPGHPLQWFECGGHGPTDNVAGEKRCKLEPIHQWFQKHVPDGR